jgi:hypothetical protein
VLSTLHMAVGIITGIIQAYRHTGYHEKGQRLASTLPKKSATALVLFHAQNRSYFGKSESNNYIPERDVVKTTLRARAWVNLWLKLE